MSDDSRHIQNGFFREYGAAKSKKDQEMAMRKHYRIPMEKPLVIQAEQSTAVRVLSWFTYTVKKAGKVLLFLLFSVLASAGLTALLNPPIRQTLADILSNLFQ